MHRLIYIIIGAIAFSLALSSCEDKALNRQLNDLDTLMRVRPDSVYAVLNSMDTRSMSKSQRMRHTLLLADAQNKAYIDFTTDSVMLEVASYYDNHGTPNEQMRAHYLLGCTYRDLGDAPMELQCFLDATEKADTAREDCNYNTLAAIYGQMAEMYHDQLLANEELWAQDMYGLYSAKGGDIYNSIRGIELKAGAFMLLCDTDAIFSTIYTAHDLFVENEMPQAAAATYVNLIGLLTEMGQYERADSMIQVFESESGLFDDNGNIEPGREHYYCDKGLFYHKTGNITKAKEYYRKGISAGNYLIALDGMKNIYSECKNVDSALFYMDRYMYELGKLESVRQTRTIQHLNSMYDYSRNQKLAAEKSEEAKHSKNIAFTVTLLLLSTIFVAYYIYNRNERRLVHELSQLNHKFIMSVSSRDKIRQQLSVLGNEYSSYKQEIEQEIISLQNEISGYKRQYAELNNVEKEKAIMQSPVMDSIKMKLPPTCDNKTVSDESWHELLLLVEQCLPNFYAKITSDNILSQDELRLAILTRLRFTPGDIVIIMEKSQVRVSNLRQFVNKKLFSDESARSLSRNIMKL